MPHAVNYYTLAVKSKKPAALRTSGFRLRASGSWPGQKPEAWSLESFLKIKRRELVSLWLWVGAEKSAGQRRVQYNEENPEDCAPGKIEPITNGQRCRTVLGMAARLCARHSGPCYWSSAAAPNRTVAVITPTPTDKPTTVETSLINSPRRSVLMSSSSSTLCPLPSALCPLPFVLDLPSARRSDVRGVDVVHRV